MRDHRLGAGQELRRLLTVCVAAVLLTGCGGDAEGRPSDSLPEPTASETTEALPPLGPPDFPVPVEARTKDESGVRAFAEYYIDLLNRQQAIPDGKPLRQLGPDCQDCHRIAQRLDAAAAAGHHIEGGKISMVGEPGIAVNGETANVNFIGRTEAISVIDSTGAPIPEMQYPANPRLPSGLELFWSGEHRGWLVSGSFFG